MNRLVLAILLLAGVAVSVAIQQNAAMNASGSRSVDRPAEPNLVFDDDGGTVQIVPPDPASPAVKRFHGGDVMKSVQQVSIFLGAGWADRQVRMRQAALADLESQQNTHIEELKENGIRGLAAASTLEDFSDLSAAEVNDLMIQLRLSALLAVKAIPAPNRSTIYVVFLAPGISSSLGAHKAGVDFAAYHNFVHLEAGEIRYVVVPF